MDMRAGNMTTQRLPAGDLAPDSAEAAAEKELRRTKEMLTAVTAHIEAGREQERIRISLELRDDLGGFLTGIGINLDQIRAQLPSSLSPAVAADIRQRLEDARILTVAGLDAVRRISCELRPPELDELGFLAAMRDEAARFQQRLGIGLLIEMSPEVAPLKGETALGMFRVFQEILANVARHAQATSVKITVAEEKDHFVLAVQDNGKGISPEDISSETSFGLFGMRERVARMGGKLMILGRPGLGTTVTVRVPGGQHTDSRSWFFG
jgi:signal transduction histidine kinase